MPNTVLELLLDTSLQAPDSVAVRDRDTAITYGQLGQAVEARAGYFAQYAAPGDRVGLLMPRDADTLAVFFAAHLAGLVTVFLHDQLRPRQIARILRHAQTTLVVTTARHRPLLREAGIPPERVVDPADLAGYPPAIRTPLADTELAALFYTSGSTGDPRGVMLSHANLVTGARIVADYLHLSIRDRTLALLPWSFDYGLNQVLATFAAGGTVIVQRSAFPPDICRTLRRANVTGMAGVPTLWNTLAGPNSPFLSHTFPALRYLTNSGGAMPTAATRAIRAAHPDTDIYAMYGLTEAFRSTYLEPALIDTKPTSVGRPIPGTEILILDDHDTPCAFGQPGQIVHRGPTVALGYWRDPHATARVFRPIPGSANSAPQMAVFTGDYGYRDLDGDLHYLGRRDEMFKSRGIRVSPTEIEAELTAGDLVVAAIVVPTPGSDEDMRILAAIQPRDPANFDLVAFDTYCRKELAVHLRPTHFTVVDRLPHTAHGKLDRIAVRNDLLRHAASQTALP